MTCRRFADEVELLVDGLLPPADAETLRGHAAGCSTCWEELRRAARFRALLAGDGRNALAAAADRRAAQLARFGANVTPGRTFRPLHARLAAAAALLAALAVGAGAAWFAAARAGRAGAGVLDLARGETRRIGEGRRVVADDAETRLEVLSDERARLVAGAALFVVDRGLPFSLETDLGTAEVQGTSFHVARRADGTVAVSVTDGVVTFAPSRRGAAPRTLRRGAVLEVAATGEQTYVARSELSDLEARARRAETESADRQALLAERDAEVAALRRQLAETPPAPAGAGAAPPSRSGIPWDELGAATRLLLQPASEDGPDRMQVMEPFLEHAAELRELTGGADPVERPWHPAVLQRTATGFVDALAPLVGAADRQAAADAIRAAAAEHLRRIEGNRVPAVATQARLLMWEAILTAARNRLGATSAAEIATALWLADEGAQFEPVPDDAKGRASVVAAWTQRLDLEDRREDVQRVVDQWFAAAKSAQQAVKAEWGDAPGTAFLFPPRPGLGRPRTPPQDAEEMVHRELRRIRGKLAVIAPRVEMERALLGMLSPDAAAEVGRDADDADVQVVR